MTMCLRLVLRVLLSSALVCTWSVAASAQTIRVHLKVSADEQLKDSLRKFLDAELEALPGVLLADTTPDYTISVIALKVVNRSSKDVGVTFSVLVTAPYDMKIREYVEAHVPLEKRAGLSALLSGIVKPTSHWVETAASGDVRQVCHSIIQSFDRDVLAPHRAVVARR